MAGTAFLPWEEWIGRLLRPLIIAIRKGSYQEQRKRLLALSADWPQVEGAVHGINHDHSYPREEIVYSYSTERGYYSGQCWRWFDSSDVRDTQVGNKVVLRYNPEEHDKSVFLGLAEM